MAATATTRRAHGAIIRAIREAQGRRADEVAAAADISKFYLSAAEHDRRRATAEPTARIAAALDVPVEVLTGQIPAIETLRTLHHLTRAALARDIGITPAQLTRLERGLDTPSPLITERLARRLAVDERAINPHATPAARVG